MSQLENFERLILKRHGNDKYRLRESIEALKSASSGFYVPVLVKVFETTKEAYGAASNARSFIRRNKIEAKVNRKGRMVCIHLQKMDGGKNSFEAFVASLGINLDNLEKIKKKMKNDIENYQGEGNEI